MRILVDSNILLRVVNLGDPQRLLASGAVAKLLQKKEELCRGSAELLRVLGRRDVAQQA